MHHLHYGAMQLVVQEALEMTWCCLGRTCLVHTDYDGQVLILSGGADDHLLGAAGLRCGARLLSVCEEACGLDDDLDAEVFPGDRRGVALATTLMLLPLTRIASSVAVMSPGKGRRWSRT